MLLLDRGVGDMVIADLNPAAVHLFRAEAESAAGFPFGSFCPCQQPDGRDSVTAAEEYCRRAARGEIVRHPWRFLSRRSNFVRRGYYLKSHRGFGR